MYIGGVFIAQRNGKIVFLKDSEEIVEFNSVGEIYKHMKYTGNNVLLFNDTTKSYMEFNAVEFFTAMHKLMENSKNKNIEDYFRWHK